MNKINPDSAELKRIARDVYGLVEKKVKKEKLVNFSTFEKDVQHIFSKIVDEIAGR